MIGTVMKMMGGRMVASYRRHQGVVPQCRMRMMRMMMTEEPDSGSRRLMLGLHRLLYLALYLAEDRMMGWPSCQVERKHGCRPLEQPGRCQQGTTGTGGTATRRQWEGQTTSWLQDHVWYQRGDCFSLRWRDLTYFASISFRARWRTTSEMAAVPSYELASVAKFFLELSKPRDIIVAHVRCR